ncbi:MAG: Kazal-type serine protease inhibitor domain-containing protein [Candidatus Pacearchaeota archaeon]
MICVSIIIVLFFLANYILAQIISSEEYLNCSNSCNYNKLSKDKYCDDSYKNSILSCKNNYESCKKINKNNKKELRKCNNNLKNCLKNSLENKKDCKKNFIEEFKECKSNCRFLKCEEEYNPVCGTDRKSYDNICFLRKAKVPLLYNGECKNYCYSDDDCDKKNNEYCQKPDGVCSNDLAININAKKSSERGICIKAPEICPEVYDPVCGCDGKTYSNICEMQSKKISKSHDGECKNKICGIENCHGLDIICGSKPAEICTQMYQIGDKCRKFAKCEIINGICQKIENNDFNLCKFCVLKCEKDFPNDPEKVLICESKC